ncbi:MAG: MmgE/PrpD family protein [Pseudomonadota bacterium]
MAATKSISAEIARFAVETRPADIAQSARQIMKLSLLDWASVAIAGRREPVARTVRMLVELEGGKPLATVIGAPARMPARAAALSNGTTSHALDYDDTHFIHIGHTSVVVVSAALAVAEQTGTAGSDFLDAALIGVETACRIGDWLGRGHYHKGFHQTATAGAFGATMACTRLLGLDTAQAEQALGIASTRASGLKSQFGTMGKPYNAGCAASNGVEAALLAAAGFVSRPDGLECAQGFAVTHAGENGDPAHALAGLGRTFVFERVQHKYHACCHGLHAMLEALMSLQGADRPTPASIESIVVTTNPQWLDVCNIVKPKTGLEAKFSYHLTAAMALRDIDTGALTAYTDEICNDPELLALRDKVEVRTDATLSDTAARIEITTRSGAVVKAEHDLDHPLPAHVRAEKLQRKVTSLLGKEPAETLWKIIGALDESDLDAFTGVLRGYGA